MTRQTPETLTDKLLALELTERERRLLDLILDRATRVEEQISDDDVSGFAQLTPPIGATLINPTRLRQASGTMNILCNHNPVICWEYSVLGDSKP